MMTPEAKFQTVVTSITVSIMYIFITKLLPKLNALDNFIMGDELVTLLGSIGLYKLLALGVTWIAKKWPWFMKKLLGSYFVGGTWTGYVKTKTGQPRIIVEHYEQTLSDLVIRGQSYKLDGELNATWYTNTAQVDARKGILHCFYSVNVLRKHYLVESIGFLQFDREGIDDGPKRMSGYSLDSDAGFELHEYAADGTLDLGDRTTLKDASGKIIFEEIYKLSDKLIAFEDGFSQGKKYFGYNADESD